jgi:hypothetical protein
LPQNGGIDMSKDQRATEFAVFCLENTAKRIGINPRDVLLELKRTDGIERFLYPSYPTLHTQGKEYIVDEVLEYIHKHNPDFATKKSA